MSHLLNNVEHAPSIPIITLLPRSQPSVLSSELDVSTFCLGLCWSNLPCIWMQVTPPILEPMYAAQGRSCPVGLLLLGVYIIAVVMRAILLNLSMITPGKF
jgi:hypothetical protein